MNELYEILRAKNVYVFAKALFDFELTETQKEIVRTIAFSEHKRVVISCMTRYGKTRCTAIGVLLYILLNKNKRILLLAPRFDQTSILRNYITEGIMNCSLMINMLDLDYENKAEHLKKEISRKRITFKNGCELIVLSAEGTAERLMGYGADCLIIDESALISYEVFRSKISRMLGDSPDSLLIEIGNPWARDNQFYEHWIDPAFKKIHVGYQTALNEGRVSPAFIQEQKQLLTPTEFQVLYESRFPDQEEDSLFKFSDVMFAVNRLLKIEKGEIVISSDPADKGMDFTVIMSGKHNKYHYAIEDIYSEAKSENTAIAGRILAKQEEIQANIINIDCIGVGIGVLSMVKEGQKTRHTNVIGCHFGESAVDSARFLNKKAENYFYLKALFEERRISIPDNKNLIKELMKIKWEFTGNGKIRIIDPEDKSPDFADALCYFCWRQPNWSYSIS